MSGGGNYWMQNTLVPQAGSTVVNGGGGGQVIGFRGDLDRRRSMQGDQVPSAQYPDGYLGTITNRREDRLLDKMQSRANQRSYQRGVHKGERIDPGDYFWPPEFQPDVGLKYEAKGLRWTAQGIVEERLAHLGKAAFETPGQMAKAAERYGVSDPQVREANPHRQAQLSRLLPNYR